MQVIATFQYSLQGPEVILPLALVPSSDYQRRYVIQIDTTETLAAVTKRITDTIPSRPSGSDSSIVSASALDDWVRDELEIQRQVGEKIIIAVLTAVTMYIVVAMVNAVVISAAPRRAEFGIARLTGLTRRQVIRMALWESLTVVAIGVFVGALAAAGTIAGATAAVSEIIGTRVVATPWLLFGGVAVGVAVIVGLTSVLTTRAATSQPAVDVAGARE